MEVELIKDRTATGQILKRKWIESISAFSSRRKLFCIGEFCADSSDEEARSSDARKVTTTNEDDDDDDYDDLLEQLGYIGH